MGEDASTPDSAPEPSSSGTARIATPPLAPSRAAQIVVAPWVQLVALPLAALFGWLFAAAASRAVVVFLIAGLLALLLNPVVRKLSSPIFPRPLAVLVVFAAFAAVVTVVGIVVTNIVVDRVQVIRTDLPSYGEALQNRVDRLQSFLDKREVPLDLRDQGDHLVDEWQARSSELTGEALRVSQELVTFLAETTFTLILVIVITIYMLLDAPRIGRLVASAFPAGSEVETLFSRMQRSLFNYVRGQTAASAVMGASAAIGVYALDWVGLWDGGAELAPVFGLIVALTEFMPSIGPALGSIPPIAVAATDGLVPFLAVLLLFILLHQIEGHIVVPKLLGTALAVHPLVVIFAIIAGAQIMGVGGILLALPLLAVLREVAVFGRERFVLGRWPQAEPLEVATGAPGPQP